MSYSTKALIFFDTNALRNIEAGKIAYSSFVFGKPYETIISFIKENYLEENIFLAVPQMVIEELKSQKQIQYRRDIAKLNEIRKRMQGLPHVNADTLIVNEDGFNCMEYIEKEAGKYFESRKINTIHYKDEHASVMLKHMLDKVVGRENVLSPFSKTGQFSDAGFKDNVVWETLMHYEKVKDFDKIIFFTKDTDYKENCIQDFETKWERYIYIEKELDNVILQLTKFYEEQIEFKSIIVYAKSDIFKDTLTRELDTKTLIQIDEIDQPIEKYEIIEFCDRVIKNIPQSEEDIPSFSFFTKAKFYYKWDEEVREVEIEIKSTLDESQELLDIDYSHHLTL
jgi:hypothetical protein